MILELVNCGARPPFSYREYKSENKICHRSDCCRQFNVVNNFPPKESQYRPGIELISLCFPALVHRQPLLQSTKHKIQHIRFSRKSTKESLIMGIAILRKE